MAIFTQVKELGARIKELRKKKVLSEENYLWLIILINNIENSLIYRINKRFRELFNVKNA